MTLRHLGARHIVFAAGRVREQGAWGPVFERYSPGSWAVGLWFGRVVVYFRYRRKGWRQP